MRTKAILLSAALMAAGVASSMAQSNVYSLNVVGYVNVVCGNAVSPNFTMIANPLNNTNNTLNNLFGSNGSFGDNVYTWDGTNTFNIATCFGAGNWIPNLALPPGSGALVSTTAPFTNTFVGTVLQGNLTNSFGSGLQIVSSLAPVSGAIDSLGFTGTLNFGDNVYKWNVGTQNYDIYTWFGSFWSPSTPVINVGESAWFQLASPGTLTTNFVVQ